ncbi:hypothetical protein CEXT_597851 [Caerostris extrusa]|uniref:Uncharacterized protein n=1 Tax=Caerostris extrusa TaxID=172846 RepID=A0AAV4UC03_CAEEX|nr:hypothetical protein CEXT_597851 [Caerostris extrusa]
MTAPHSAWIQLLRLFHYLLASIDRHPKGIFKKILESDTESRSDHLLPLRLETGLKTARKNPPQWRIIYERDCYFIARLLVVVVIALGG